ncbi:hypothetical protein [Mycetocola zhadangensis]|uniref:Fungal lipase-like domain-containing protein n=1 Tax=Mycetocola zhadangensis TaxID=1164595 RepID=A0A3L7J4X6_9MICO|nr:hypothetical protein [Mycetocola zhadangensis]RLQ85375.1 hypothetical protein D9V28_00305 [Mycetocola zhadangensis]GGE82055.1 hypothetical protein GCM10011313_00600 [Mycetocola zhadangensis]
MSGITVSGGVGGVGANLDDMSRQAGKLRDLGGLLVDKGIESGRVLLDGDYLESVVLSPITASLVGAKVAVVTGGLALLATETTVIGLFLDGAVIAYRLADSTLAALAEGLANAGTFAAGVFAVPLAIIGAGGALIFTGAAGVDAAVDEAVSAVQAGLAGTAVLLIKNPWLAGDPAALLAELARRTAANFSGDDVAADFTDTMTDAMQDLNELAGDQSWFVDVIANGAPGLLSGLTFPLAALLGPDEAGRLLSSITGGPWPPRSYEEAIQAILGGGQKFGQFDDGTVTMFDPGPPDTATSPTSIADLMHNSGEIDDRDGDGSFARIRIVEAGGEPPHWVVQIPSTQGWATEAGSTPNDVTSDLHAMAGYPTALADAVRQAMAEAGIGATDPVMLEGFSLGGITAGMMAADKSLPFNVTHVVTAGSPIARFPIDPDIQVLALEHSEDPVARLDGRGNPVGSNWTTVQTDAPWLASEDQAPGIAGAHSAERYGMTAQAAATQGDPSFEHFVDSASGFLRPDGTVVDYGAKRP